MVPDNEPVIAASSRIYRYGDGFFETMRFTNEKVLLWDLHWQRIARNNALLKLPVPETWDDLFIHNCIVQTCEKNKHHNARIRVTFLREGTGQYYSTKSSVHFIIETIAVDHPNYHWEENGIKLGSFVELTKNSNYTSSIKTCSSLVYVMAGIFAAENNFDEAIIFNEAGRVSEGFFSNVFIVNDGKIMTPPLSEYCVDGVMRKHIMQLATAYGYEMLQVPLDENDLMAADEIFMTNASSGIKWVSDFKGIQLRNDTAKVLHQKLIGN